MGDSQSLNIRVRVDLPDTNDIRSQIEDAFKGLKDIDADIDLNLDVIGFVDPDATVNIIKNGVLVEKRSIGMPETLTNVIKCKNPRCITSCEQELDHIFKLTDKSNKVYRCIYCETKA